MSRSVHRCIYNLLGPRLMRRGAELLHLIEAWNDFVNLELARVSYPKRIVGRKKRVLEVCVQREYSTLAHFASEDILARVNEYFGRDFLSRVKVVSVELSRENLTN